MSAWPNPVILQGFLRLHTFFHSCGRVGPSAPGRSRFPRLFHYTRDVDKRVRKEVRLYSPTAGRVPAHSFFSDDDETDLPAERSQAQAQARLPRAHVDARRPPHPQAAPRKGSQAPVSLTPVQRRNRLSRSRDFDAVYRQGRSVSTRFLTLWWGPRDEPVGEPRLGFAVPRGVGNAVVRNRIKRQLREIMRGRLETRPAGERLRPDRPPGPARGGRGERPRVARGARRRGAREGGRMIAAVRQRRRSSRSASTSG